MTPQDNSIRKRTVEALARGLYQEASKYGLQQPEIIRFVNILLQLSMQQELNGRVQETPSAPAPNGVPSSAPCLSPAAPLQDQALTIRRCMPDVDRPLLETWLEDALGQQFLRYRLSDKIISLDELLDESRHLLGIVVPNEIHTERNYDSQPAQPIGCVAFLDFDQTHQKAELRKLIGVPAMRNKGYGKRATRLWINYGLQTLQLKKIYLNTLSNNIRNIRINEELGFSVEGILRNEVFLDGRHHDIIRMGLCAS